MSKHFSWDPITKFFSKLHEDIYYAQTGHRLTDGIIEQLPGMENFAF